MIDSTIHQYSYLNWFELIEIVFFIPLVLLVLILLKRCFGSTQLENENFNKNITLKITSSWEKIPELQLLMFSVPLQLLWEIAQFPLYTIWHESNWSYILYGLIHCTLGDMLILLSVFWFVSFLSRSRNWIYSPTLFNTILFTVFGLGYTIFSEIVNTRFINTWSYTELMPIVPIINVGGMPVLQWILIPPVLIWFMHFVKPIQTA